DMNVFGPIARSPRDLELLFDAVVGPDPEDALARRIELPAPRRARINDYRIGCWFDEPEMPVASNYRAALARTAETLRGAGAHVDDSHPNVRWREQVDLWMALAAGASSTCFPEEMGVVTGGPHVQWLRNHERRQGLRQIWHAWFGEYDVMLC